MKLLAVATIVFLLQQASVEQPAKSSIEGVVVRIGTNEPISRARITVVRSSGREEDPASPSVTSDSQGRFIIKDLAPGAYRITAQRNGFVRQEYGQRAPGRPGAALNVVAGQSVKDLVFRLIPGGAVGGRISDQFGEPLPGITVQLLRSYYDENGRRSFETAGSARTDDRGEYRIYSVTPGRYFVNANPSGEPLDNEAHEPGYVLTYYPGASDASGAASIEVLPAAELAAVNFTMTQQKLFRVRGRVFDVKTGRSPERAGVSISRRDAQEGPSYHYGPDNARYNKADGTFEFRDVAPGSYWVTALGAPGTNEMGRHSAMAAIEVNNSDVENVVLGFAPGFSIRGRILLENGTTISSLRGAAGLYVALTPITVTAGVQRVPVNTDGTFNFDSLPSGDYRVQAGPLPEGYYIKSARLAQIDVLNGLSVSGPGSGVLDILFSPNAGKIDGTIVDKDRKPMAGVQVVLIPDRQRNRPDLYKRTTSDQSGRFSMLTIPPGDYKLFAWEDLEPYAYHDPDFLRRYEELGRPVNVSESSKLTVESKIIPAGQ